MYDSYERDQHLKYDVVIAQPPVGIKREDYRQLSYEKQFPVITNDVVGMFIQQAIFSLKPSGRAIIAIPEGLLFSKNRSQIELRRYLVEHGYIEAVVRIPPKTLIEDSGIRGALLLLSNSKKRTQKSRFADLGTYFQHVNSKPSQLVHRDLLNQILERLFCEELPEAIPLPSGVIEGTPGSGVSTRAFWDISVEEITSNNWDLTPVRKQDDALTHLLNDFRTLIGNEVKVENLSKNRTNKYW